MPHPKITATESGFTITLKVLPGSKRDEIRGVYDGALKIAVSQVAEKGKANKSVLSFLAKTLNIRKSDLEILAGHTDSRKTVLVKTLDLQTIKSRLSF